MSPSDTQDDCVVRWTFKGIVVVLFLGLGIGFLGGYGIRAVQSRIQETQLSSLCKGTVNKIGFALEEHKSTYGSYPDSLAILDFQKINFSPTEEDLASAAFYLSTGDTYELILGISAATWIDEGRIVRYRRFFD